MAIIAGSPPVNDFTAQVIAEEGELHVARRMPASPPSSA
jgi:hypothetical protein